MAPKAEKKASKASQAQSINSKLALVIKSGKCALSDAALAAAAAAAAVATASAACAAGTRALRRARTRLTALLRPAASRAVTLGYKTVLKQLRSGKGACSRPARALAPPPVIGVSAPRPARATHPSGPSVRKQPGRRARAPPGTS